MTKKLIQNEVLEMWKNIDPDNWKVMANEIIQIFNKTAPEQYSSLVDLALKEDWGQVGKIAHTLKSSCGNVGAQPACILLNQVEEMCRTPGKEIHIVLKKLDPIFQETLVILSGTVIR